MTYVVIFLTGMALVAARQVRLFWRRLRGRPVERPPRRLSNRQLASFALMQFAFAVLLVAGHGNGWTFESVGLRGLGANGAFTLLAGELAFFVLVIIYFVLVKVAGRCLRMYRAANVANLSIWPRGRAQKWLAGILIMGFNPFTEELVMRGILIHQWGALLGSPLLPIVVGALLNGALHLYQGWRLQLWHALFFTMAVALLYSPWGLGAAITAHVFGDVIPIVTLRRNQRRLRNRRRNERMIRAP